MIRPLEEQIKSLRVEFNRSRNFMEFVREFEERKEEYSTSEQQYLSKLLAARNYEVFKRYVISRRGR